MKLLLDSQGKVNYDKITVNTTAQEFLEAVDRFLAGHPLPCSRCEESCCRKPWAVAVDNVCAGRLCGGGIEAAAGFVKDRLAMRRNHFMGSDQYVLKKESQCSYITKSNLCAVYEQRPLICRLFICGDLSYRYNLVRQLIAAACLKALVLEQELGDCFTEGEINQCRRNPALFAKNYDIPLADIFSYAKEEGWLEPDDEYMLYSPLQYNCRR